MAKTTTAITVKTPTQNVIEAIDAKITSIKRISESPFKTAMVLDSPFGDLKNERKVDTLIRAAGSIIGMGDHYEKAAKALKVETYPTFMLKGCRVEDWLHDINLRIQIVNQEETLKELESLRAEMGQFMTAEERKEVVLEKMKKFMESIA